jgi:hypothetical protein
MVGARTRHILLVAGLPLGSFVVIGCVQDPQVENETVPPVGIEQPGPGSSTIGADSACTELVDAETAARAKLGCPDSVVSLACPDHLFLAGSQPCDEYDEASVEACVQALGAYGHCSDFDRKPCVVTVIATSCHAPRVAEGGAVDAAADAGPTTSAAEAGTDASPGLPIEGGPGDASSLADATLPPVDAGED